ncbi:MAG TPA: hypothetical protein VM537_15550, partial [Anaerolineae bacterium]|nr:hypothetical protein [Anaerolineae bacterium]
PRSREGNPSSSSQRVHPLASRALRKEARNRTLAARGGRASERSIKDVVEGLDLPASKLRTTKAVTSTPSNISSAPPNASPA